MPHLDTLRIRVALIAVGATSENLDTERVPRGELWHVTHMSFEDETTAFTEGRISVEGHGYRHWLEEQDSPGAATLFWSNNDYWLGEGEFLRLQATGLTAADVVNFYVSGQRLYATTPVLFDGRAELEPEAV